MEAVAPSVGESAQVNVLVTAGESLGRYWGSVDYNVVDEEVTLDFLVPESYDAEPWKIHVKDPFDYFTEPIHSQLLEKCLRSAEPEGGKIMYDVDGRLVGNWFLEGTNGYRGADQDRYWAGHLSFAYDWIDPSEIIVSIGTFIDSAKQFGVKGNAPDPAEVSTETGVVVFELVTFDYYVDEALWDRTSFARGIKCSNYDNQVQGVLLCQLLEDQVVKVEVFPQASAASVSGFTENAQIYVR